MAKNYTSQVPMTSKKVKAMQRQKGGESQQRAPFSSCCNYQKLRRLMEKKYVIGSE